ncbi:MAG: biotin--[acetyl-CoA-carboxylase] ligase [Firmicutes bacterium]|nr:biotin--[acetyl-CoA-carboxylase] ligase [Bacillota bacterium]
MNAFKSLIQFDELDSTNDFARDHLDELENHAVVVAKHQRKGRGQYERTWESDTGKNLLFSILFKEEIPSQTISHIAVLSLIETLHHFEIEASFKLPNDILVGKDKIAGMLIETKYEMERRTSLILGIGLNVNQVVFQTERATSMKKISAIDYSLDEVLKVFLEKLDLNLF